jgi:protein-L-isoaspartate O-methyltransferase
MPVTIPVEGNTVAIHGAAELHVPPAVASLKVVVKPGQTCAVPVIATGVGYTVTAMLSEQPDSMLVDPME